MIVIITTLYSYETTVAELHLQYRHVEFGVPAVRAPHGQHVLTRGRELYTPLGGNPFAAAQVEHLASSSSTCYTDCCRFVNSKLLIVPITLAL